MSTTENLNERVEKAVRNFRLSEEKRREENRSLSGILNDLEIKFEARTAELDDCHERIRQLEASNVSLNALVCQLVEIVENTADESAHDPVYRARSAAAEIVDRFVTGEPANDRSSMPEVSSNPDTEAGNATELEPDSEPESAKPQASLADGRFEDIEDEFRLAEDLYEKTEGASDFPKLVYDAIALAAGDAPVTEETSVAAVDEPINIPEPEEAEAPAPGGDLDIKEIMARLELAAERAQLRADEDARRDQAATDQKQVRTA